MHEPARAHRRSRHRPADDRLDRPAVGAALVTGTWFVVEVPFRPGTLPPGVHTVAEVAARTGRSRAAVVEAVRSRRIARAAVDRRFGVCVHATAEQLTAWRRVSLEELLAARPDLPQALEEWRGVAEVGRLLGVSYQVAAWRLARLVDAPCLEWGGGTPFRRERRWCLATLPSEFARPLRRRRPPPG